AGAEGPLPDNPTINQIIFDVLGDGVEATIFVDNVFFYTVGSGGTGSNLASNGDFETGDETGWFVFQNGGTAALDNTLSNGGTWSGKLTVGESGGNPAFKQERIGAGTVAAGDVVQVQFDHIGSIVQPGAAVNVLLFGEGATGVSFTQVLTPGPVLENTWTTYTGTFTIPGGTDVTDGISFLIETVCGAGVTGCSVTMNIDNVSVTLNP
ncbi:carbohydrate binding domain-containing protein, partial [Lentiprolixibacter aurantiacus]